jgi:hypothetical protein
MATLETSVHVAPFDYYVHGTATCTNNGLDCLSLSEVMGDSFDPSAL